MQQKQKEISTFKIWDGLKYNFVIYVFNKHVDHKIKF